MKKLFLIATMLSSAHVFGASLYCTFKPKDCMHIQGELIPFDEVESIVDSCERMTRRSMGQRALNTSLDEIMKISRGDINNPLLDAHLAYQYLHDSKLKFDRRIDISQRYPHVLLACKQAHKDYYR